MIFLILTAFAAIALIVAPISALVYLGKAWKLPNSLFWKAGLSMIMMEIFYLAAVGNATSLWPQVFESSDLIRILIVAASTGLIFELGRFFVLDRLFKSVRSIRGSVFFALGWSGVETMMLGFFLLVSIFGMYFVLNNGSFSSIMPNATTQEIAQLEDVKIQAMELIQGNPLLAVAPVIERGARALIDMAMTLLIVLTFIRGEQRYAWYAVGARATVTFILLYVNMLNPLAALCLFIAAGAGALLLCVKLKALFPKQAV